MNEEKITKDDYIALLDGLTPYERQTTIDVINNLDAIDCLKTDKATYEIVKSFIASLNN